MDASSVISPNDEKSLEPIGSSASKESEHTGSLELEIISSKDCFLFGGITCRYHSGGMMTSLGELRSDGNFCDVTIKSGDLEIKAHRNILASATEYFKAMFLNETKEAETGIVDFSKMSSVVMKQCIEFIYSGRVGICMDIARELLDASEMLQLPRLSKLCVEYIADHVNIETCAEVITLSSLYNKDSLNESIGNFIEEHADEFIECDDFTSLDYDVLTYFFDILDEYAECEIQKWDGILTWINHDIEERECHFTSLFKMLDLESFAKGFIKETVCEEKLVNDSVECLRLVRDFFVNDGDEPSSASKLDQVSHVISFNTSSRDVIGGTLHHAVVSKLPVKITLDMNVIYHIGNIYVGTGLKIFEYSKGEWLSRDVQLTKVKRNDACITCCNCHRDHWYLEHEYDNYEMQRALWSSRSTHTRTMRLQYLPTCYYCSKVMDKLSSDDSCYSRCVGLQNYVYMITGNYIIRYNTVSSKILHLNISIGLGNGFVLAASEQLIYAMGGNGTECTTVVYDPATNRLLRVCDMQFGKSFGVAVFSDNMLYAANKDSTNIEYYASNIDEWHAAEDKIILKPPTNVHFGNGLQLLDANLS